MKPDQRIVTKTPLAELWDEEGTLDAERVRSIDRKSIADLLRIQPLRFVVADCGSKLKWVPPDQRFEFWRSVRDQIADPTTPIYPSHFRNARAYSASEWRNPSGDCVILLEAHH